MVPRLLLILIASLLFGAVHAAERAEAPDQKAQAVASAWLSLLDTEKFEASIPFLKAQIRNEPRDKVVDRLRQIREPLGKFLSRKSQPLSIVPEPFQQGVQILEYESTFQSGKAQLERVSLILEPDGE
jgi:hypothetical protein